MQAAYSSWQWSVLVTLRLFVGSRLFLTGLAALGALGWDSPRQLHPGSFLVQLLGTLELGTAILDSVERAYGAVFAALGVALILGFYSRAAAAVALTVALLALTAQIPIASFAAASIADAVVFFADDLLLCIVLAVLLAFPSGKEFGIDAFIGEPKRHLSGNRPVEERTL